MASRDRGSRFHFRGRVPSSKSLLNRALILKSYHERLQLRGDSDAEDVIFLRKALGKITDGKEFYCGDGGTTLRFFTLRTSRVPGSFTIKGSERLFRRPQGALIEVCSQLGVQVEQGQNCLLLRSPGWQNPGRPLKVPTGDSSQFASAVVLNAWNLSFDLELEFEGPLTSESYFRMTLDLCRQAGMSFEQEGSRLRIPAGQTISLKELSVEPDMSSLFSLAALAALNGDAEFFDVPVEGMQPDRAFIEIFKQMSVPVEVSGTSWRIRRAERLRPIEVDLSQSPDLVPVLSVVCAFADGKSILKGAPHLRHKESDRIRTTADLLRRAGIKVHEREDGLEIEGRPDLPTKAFHFDPDQDHRLAMAAGIFHSLGFEVHLQHAHVVAKSFPEFWRVLGAGPHLVVGHRGVGKTSFLQRLSAPVVDLDQEIESRSGQTTFDLFKNRGEEIFRQWELSTLKDLLRDQPLNAWLALGAGLRLESAEKAGEILWIRRDTDRDGRVFLDRPRLDPAMDPLGEFRQRARAREELYGKYADRIYTMPEGLNGADEIEQKILDGDLGSTGGAVTLLTMHRRTLPQLGADLYELRDDVLDPDEIHSLFHKLPEKNILYSVREQQFIPGFIRHSKVLIDWGLDGGYPEKDLIEELGSRLILSSHGTYKEALLDFKLFAKHPVLLKMSPLIESFEDLQAGHLWWSQDPERRIFLPRSADGRWGWYRLWMKGRTRLNFWREGAGSALDQPTLYHWLATPARTEKFSAVLGSPVHHSWTPVEQRPFFAAKGLPVWAIEVREGEWATAFPFLKDLGLRFAAVTSPLKGLALRSSHPTPLATELRGVNTLVWDETQHQWQGHNTDFEGLTESARDLTAGPIAIWGGGGTLHVLGHVLPGSSAFSARTGSLRQGSPPLKKSPRVVVWAAPRGEDLRWPPDDWRPDFVFDLNYKEDSPGREYALRCKARYLSGEKMFRAQAKGQREFWKPFLEKI